jgi:hypothetical protein
MGRVLRDTPKITILFFYFLVGAFYKSYLRSISRYIPHPSRLRRRRLIYEYILFHLSNFSSFFSKIIISLVFYNKKARNIISSIRTNNL